MRKFIISDIHGNGNLYFSVMNYLAEISKDEEVTLYINGDLIDRGKESGLILLDVISRINDKNKNINIIYLGGNHELMMYELYQNRIKGKYAYVNDWYRNGGDVTDNYLINTLKHNDKLYEVVNFISNLKIYHKFAEKINGKNIVLVHAACPSKVKDECDLRIKDDNSIVDHAVWARKHSIIPFKHLIGHKDYFTIIGHTPNCNKSGYTYDKNENTLNIDGGSAEYVLGLSLNNCYPLVEVKDDYLRIISFGNDGEINGAHYLINNDSIDFNENELNTEKKLAKKLF